ncbi:nicotinate phosphoribosyltransferase [Kushneria phosphatilytica]|uniref:Nicotinate phosphoribosyltransferase n=1 Tax=Kushneria phosphatilytica TaxID=657387 RepID=A0A1S1NV19_9GAMM|nr:nicotinate phosphoribosyltransferase [Kushneria phosphatilytica]OHV10570.1 nicotinate phosphoribosyltransferase [Kushneria phosphatilytica]QEL11857.1 nicotinate phosphoribosyltransferase [Kushneria phosphatilytica]
MLHSILDNDFYKFTMQNAVVKLFPNAMARYAFINRGEHRFPPGFGQRLRVLVDEMAALRLSGEERRFLEETCPYLDPTYHDFLQGFRYNPAEVTIEQHGEELSVTVEGLWYRTILWEVPLMTLISQLWFEMLGEDRDSNEKVLKRTREKIEHYHELGVRVAEFGTRRRYSYEVHDQVVAALKKYGGNSFTGSSNVHLAHRHDVKPLGTHAHEWFMFHAARFGFKMANILALEHWVRVYRGDLGIALSDTFTTQVFFESFDKMFTKLFDGVRHDSGDPVEFAQRTIAHYERFGIDPRSKTIIFSDALDTEKVDRIARFCSGRIGMSFGIGTNFTNDVGLKPLNMVVKMTDTRPEGRQWVPVVKLSDIRAKNTGDPEMIQLARRNLSLPE